MTLGWGVFGVGNLLRFAAMRFAAQMVLSGLGSLQFVMIPIVSNFLLGDKYTWEAFVSIVIILGGDLHRMITLASCTSCLLNLQYWHFTAAAIAHIECCPALASPACKLCKLRSQKQLQYAALKEVSRGVYT